MHANKNNTLLIKAGGGGFLYEGIRGEGYQVFNPYVEHNLFERILREICFRLKILPHKIWYNKKIKRFPADFIFVWDTLITKDFLEWIYNLFPNAQRNFIYFNMVGKAKHLHPKEIPSSFKIWTYDNYDSSLYGINFYQHSPFFKTFIKPKQNIEYDVIFVGADKGRGDYLVNLDKKMQSLGLRTHFVIVATGRLSKKKDYYQPSLPYGRVIELITKTKAILNVAMENQQGITLRDMESIFLNVKLLTTNKNIVNQDFYCPNNVYVVENLNLDNFLDFMKKPYIPVNQRIKEKYTFDSFIREITESTESL